MDVAILIEFQCYSLATSIFSGNSILEDRKMVESEDHIFEYVIRVGIVADGSGGALLFTSLGPFLRFETEKESA